MLLGLVTNRSQKDVDRRNELAKKGWNNMTDLERAEWTGDIMSPYAGTVNLLPNNNFYSDLVRLKFKNKEITATAAVSGRYLYAVVIIGAGDLFEQKTMTLSVDSIAVNGGGSPLVALYWHDENGYDAVPGASLDTPGTVTFDTRYNDGARDYLAMYIYAATDAVTQIGDSISYGGIMLEMGNRRHPYIPYEVALPTSARRGAYNYTDLNRVERAVEELAEELSLKLVTKTDWTAWDIPKQADMDRYLANITAIRRAGAKIELKPTAASTPPVPRSMKNLSYSHANAIEKILYDVSLTVAEQVRSGELICGEV